MQTYAITRSVNKFAITFDLAVHLEVFHIHESKSK